MRRSYCAAVFCFGVLIAGTGAAASVPKAPLDRDASVRHALEAMVQRGEIIGGVAAVYQDGKASFVAVGKKYYGEPAPDPGTLYPLASITKVFTSALLAYSVDTGKMKLDEPIDRHLPNYARLRPEVKGKLTFERLATFTASLPDGTPSRYKTPREFFTGFLSRWAPRWRIGSRDKYSDMSYEILAYLVPRIEGSSYEALLGRVITGPLGMGDTYPITQRNPDSNRAYGKNRDGKKTTYSRQSWDEVGYLTSTPADMMKFLQACIGVASGSSALDQALTLAMRPHFPMRHGRQQALAWVVETVATGEGKMTLISKNGAIGGFDSLIVVDPQDHSGIVFLSSRDAEKSKSHPDSEFSAIAHRLLTGGRGLPGAAHRRIGDAH